MTNYNHLLLRKRSKPTLGSVLLPNDNLVKLSNAGLGYYNFLIEPYDFIFNYALIANVLIFFVYVIKVFRELEVTIVCVGELSNYSSNSYNIFYENSDCYFFSFLCLVGLILLDPTNYYTFLISFVLTLL